jgi:hypothetical protein
MFELKIAFMGFKSAIVKILRQLSLILSRLLLLFVHLLILTFLLGIVNDKLAELLIYFLPLLVLSVGYHGPSL